MEKRLEVISSVDHKHSFQFICELTSMIASAEKVLANAWRVAAEEEKNAVWASEHNFVIFIALENRKRGFSFCIDFYFSSLRLANATML